MARLRRLVYFVGALLLILVYGSVQRKATLRAPPRLQTPWTLDDDADDGLGANHAAAVKMAEQPRMQPGEERVERRVSAPTTATASSSPSLALPSLPVSVMHCVLHLDSIPKLSATYKHADAVLSDEVGFQVFFNSDLPESLVREALPRGPSKRAVVLTPVTLSWKVDRHGYSHLLGSSSLWSRARSEYMLNLEADARICVGRDTSGARLKELIALKYDYIGALWSRGDCGPNKFFPRCVGNSGLALFRTSTMLRFTQAHADYTGGLEIDMFLSHTLQAENSGVVADEATARRFSVETQWDPTVNNDPFGVHKPWNYITGEDYKRLKQVCPAL